MIKFSRVASEAEIQARKRESVEFLRTEEPKTERKASLGPELLSYLKLIAEMPSIPATERDAFAGIRLKKGNTMRQQLKTLGLIVEFEAIGKKGRKAVHVRLTEEGNNVFRRFLTAS